MYSGQARYKLPAELDKLLTSQMELAIDEANLGQLNRQIARRYLLDHAAQIDIAAEVGYDRSVISRRLKDITLRVMHAASKLPPS